MISLSGAIAHACGDPDATSCVKTGINQNTSDDRPRRPPCTTLLEHWPGARKDQIFGTADDGTVSSIGSDLLSFIPTSSNGDGQHRGGQQPRPQ